MDEGSDKESELDLQIESSHIVDDMELVRSHNVASWLESCRVAREAAFKSSNKAAAKMIAIGDLGRDTNGISCR